MNKNIAMLVLFICTGFLVCYSTTNSSNQNSYLLTNSLYRKTEYNVKASSSNKKACANAVSKETSKQNLEA